MKTFTVQEGIILLLGFWLAIYAVTALWSRKKNTVALFLVANREVGAVLGAFSTAAAWVWAPALFVSSQKAFQQGLPGIFWFTFPNALSLVLFAVLAKRIRNVMDRGYTLPEFVHHRLGARSHFVHIITIFVAQTYAVIVQLTGSLLLLNLLTGISKTALVLILSALFLSLASLRGLRSSLMTDIVKSLMIGVVGIIVIPWTVLRAGGASSILGGLGGSSGMFANLFDPQVAWSFGVPISVSLLSGITIDQQQWQRAFAIRKGKVVVAFVLGGVLFALVPIALSLLGFIAANPAVEVPVDNAQLAGVAAVARFLPRGGILLFAIMILAGLASAGSAALCAVSSIGAIDIYKQYLSKSASEKQTIWFSRLTMLLILLIAMGIALLPNVQILYIQLLVGSFRAALLVPTILSLYWKKSSGSVAFYGMVAGILVGVPLFVYGSIVNNPTISSIGSLLPIAISTMCCVVGSYIKPSVFDYDELSLSYAAD